RYWQILRKYRFSLIMCPILVLITVICETIQPRFMSIIVDEGIGPRDISVVSRIGIYIYI
ncbi:MAG: ABC transporter ATP-binding protein, partial [Odoribacter sp.]|nr:ABC transporter ATP-binding protein [Odoribacter sp.]